MEGLLAGLLLVFIIGFPYMSMIWDIHPNLRKRIKGDSSKIYHEIKGFFKDA